MKPASRQGDDVQILTKLVLFAFLQPDTLEQDSSMLAKSPMESSRENSRKFYSFDHFPLLTSGLFRCWQGLLWFFAPALTHHNISSSLAPRGEDALATASPAQLRDFEIKNNNPTAFTSFRTITFNSYLCFCLQIHQLSCFF
ncbi:uncharacterized protein LJ206_013859 isoform 2-T2 [Theristicus caerulescens]